MKATNIIWDVDYEEDLEALPDEIEIPDEITDEEEISDYLSDVTGFCHKGFVLKSESSLTDKINDAEDRKTTNSKNNIFEEIEK